MAFDPDAYLASGSKSSGGFDPDAYLAGTSGMPSGRQPAFEGSKAYLIPGAETEVPPTPEKKLGVVGRAKDILKGAVEIPTTMAYNLATMPIAAVATGGKPEQWSGALKPVESEFAKSVLGGMAEGAEKLKIPALTPGMLVATGGNLVRPAIQQGAGIANKLAAPVVEAGVNALAPVVEKVKAPLEARKERIAAEKSAQSYRRAPQIEASKDAADLNIGIPADVSNPNLKTKTIAKIGGKSKIAENLAESNRNPVHIAIAEDLGLPPEKTTLVEQAFNDARQNVAPAYDAVKNVELFKADEAILNQINDLRRDPALIADKGLKGKIDKLVDSAVGRIGDGLTGKELLKNVSDLRAKAKTLRDNPNKRPRDVEIADTYMGIAKSLEELIDTNISDPKMLSNYQKARETMAKSYVAQEITDLSTGIPDVSKLARLAAKPNALTGNLKKLANVAANYPDAFKSTPPGMGEIAGNFTRSGIPGTIGAIIGENIGGGLVGGITGGAVGAGLGYLGGKAVAKHAASRGYQRANALAPDYRIMPNQLSAQTAQAPRDNKNRNALNK